MLFRSKLAAGIADADAIRQTMLDCKRRDLHPGAVVALPRVAAAEAIRPFAPGSAAHMAGGPPKPGWHWAAFVAFNGTTLNAFEPTTGEVQP